MNTWKPSFWNPKKNANEFLTAETAESAEENPFIKPKITLEPLAPYDTLFSRNKRILKKKPLHRTTGRGALLLAIG
jgi:hypothetical protein